MLPLDQVKIDAMFLHEAGRGGRADAIVRSLVELAHGLGLETVAEGVESRLAWDAVGALGCDLAQGFYFGHPMPARKLTEWLAGSWPVGRARRLGTPLRAGARRPPRRAARPPTREEPQRDESAAANATSPTPSIDVVSTGSQNAAARSPTTAARDADERGLDDAAMADDDQSGSTPRAAGTTAGRSRRARATAPATPFGAGSSIAPRYAENVNSGPGIACASP